MLIFPNISLKVNLISIETFKKVLKKSLNMNFKMYDYLLSTEWTNKLYKYILHSKQES